jgi:hypothetical protein
MWPRMLVETALRFPRLIPNQKRLRSRNAAVDLNHNDSRHGR